MGTETHGHTNAIQILHSWSLRRQHSAGSCILKLYYFFSAMAESGKPLLKLCLLLARFVLKSRSPGSGLQLLLTKKFLNFSLFEG